MPVLLSRRDTTSTEQMDDPDCDPRELENTYRQFGTINGLISQWRRVYRQEIRPFLRREGSATLLDVGFGGGDVPLQLHQWAADDGAELQITAIDTDPRAMDYVQGLETPKEVEFQQASTTELVREQRCFDFVISNHLLHHIPAAELPTLLEEVRQLSHQAVIFNDIKRSDWAYLAFGMLSGPVFQRSFITRDGLTSIKRSYTFSELVKAVPDGWQVRSLFPFRLLLLYYHS